MEKAKNCNGCGETDPNKFTTGKAKCRKCRGAIKQAWRKSKEQAKTDPSLHDYRGVLPPGYHQTGQSQLIDGDDNIRLTWVKSSKDKDSRQDLEEYIEALKDAFENIKGIVDPTPEPVGDFTDELLDIVPIGDAHIGLMTWWQEVGENFDLKIARAMYGRAFARLFRNDTRAKTLIMANLGDYFHTDGGKNQTTKGTPLDVDGRWPKVLKTGVQIMIDAIRLALERYSEVKIYSMAGNHDKEAAIALRLCLLFAFEDEPRVTIVESPKKYEFLEFGKCLIGFTHGDTAKPEALPMIMAADAREAWGRTDHQHYYTGHLHHDRLKDIGPVTVETVRVLGPADAWHTEAGYRSRRDIKLDTWSKDHGRVDRSVFGIKRILDET